MKNEYGINNFYNYEGGINYLEIGNENLEDNEEYFDDRRPSLKEESKLVLIVKEE